MRSLVHGDVKLDNFMHEDGNVRLADFGKSLPLGSKVENVTRHLMHDNLKYNSESAARLTLHACMQLDC